MIVAEIDTQRRVTRLGVEWPVLHRLYRLTNHWTIVQDYCGGDASLCTRTNYTTRKAVQRAWQKLESESC